MKHNDVWHFNPLGTTIFYLLIDTIIELLAVIQNPKLKSRYIAFSLL